MASSETLDDPQTLVSTHWLMDRIEDPGLRILDASWYLPDMGRDARAEFAASHIPGARFFDIDDVSDHRSDLPHMMPPVEKYVSRMRALGIGDGMQVVVYDGMGLFSAARVWWMMRHMGHRAVAVLDGGLPKWTAEGRPVTDAQTSVTPRHLIARREPALLAEVTDVARAAKLGDSVIVDARPPERFRGEVTEPRPGVRSGHIPRARNLFFREVLQPDGTMKPAPELRRAFEAAGVDLERPVITSCGSGVTAAILSLALERIGKTDHALYDGSWSEWGTFTDLPVETGPASMQSRGEA